jgi:phage terminase large subunit-like protein
LPALLNDWMLWGRPEQLAPAGNWRTWVFFGGRGAGKTRAGAEWVSRLARSGRAARIALIAPTFHDVREVMIEGNSGLRALRRERPVYEASRRRLSWANGAQAFAFSAEDPESLRGPQFDAAWADELCFWGASG